MSSLLSRSLKSVSWTAAVNIVSMAILFIRSILLTRILPIELFGVYGFANSLIATSGVLYKFGMGSAFIHRSKESSDETHTAAIHFTLKLMIGSFWLAVLLILIFLFTDHGDLRTALLVLTVTTSLSQIFLQTPELILTRRVIHRRLAMIELSNTIIGTAVVLYLLFTSANLWSLLATHIVQLFVPFFFFYIWKPFWRPQLKWDKQTVLYFLSFGIRTFAANSLLKALDRFDDIWTGFFLGNIAMGFYSRAYRFATYPRQLIAIPINKVILGTYAELKDNRLQLSQAFFRTNALLIRTGFFAAGLLALIAPEFIRLLLTDKWLPMLAAFRLMLVFTLLDPLKGSTASLFIAVGKPEKLVRIRLVQLVILTIGLFTLGFLWGIVGVAIAVNLMLICGIFSLFYAAKHYVDFSIIRLFSAPLAALTIGGGVAIIAQQFLTPSTNDWWTAGLKIVIFVIGYSITLISLEYHLLNEMFWQLYHRFKSDQVNN